ncbi:MAG: DUF3108 domain-containing protein [Alphaproteobacteria bacterium]|nr:DUF3108 domain-containing protein [Alphaproteobacteria bacterium]
MVRDTLPLEAALTTTRVILFTAFLTVGVLPAAGQERLAWAPEDRIELVYDVFAGGRVAELALAFDITGLRYSISTRQASAGVLRWIWSWESVAQVRGRFLHDGVQPDTYRVLGRSGGKSRTVAIDYHDGEPAHVTAEPSNKSDGRDEVPAALRHGTVDPASAIMGILRRVNEGGSCDARTAVFDGRQRYDIVFRDSGVRMVDASLASNFTGEARVCEFSWVPIAGRTRREGAPVRAEDDKRYGRAFIARIGDGPTLAPVRVEFEAWFGTVVGNLRAVNHAATTAKAAN